MTTAAPYRLITLGPSHFCEKARWALNRVGAAYREEPHMPLLHWAATFRAGAGRTVPVLVTPQGALGDSTAILLYLDQTYGAEAAWRPYPEDTSLRGQVLALEDHFDQRLGPDTRRVAYYQLRAEASLLRGVMGHGVSALEQRIFKVLGELPFWLVRRATGAHGDRAARALARVEAAFAEVSRRVPGGEGFLLGERFTAADLTFAALAGPVLFVGQPDVEWMPTLEQLPAELREIVSRLRETDAGRYVLRLYAEERAPSAAFPAAP
jgi:glutathione S-transferase